MNEDGNIQDSRRLEERYWSLVARVLDEMSKCEVRQGSGRTRYINKVVGYAQRELTRPVQDDIRSLCRSQENGIPIKRQTRLDRLFLARHQ